MNIQNCAAGLQLPKKVTRVWDGETGSIINGAATYDFYPINNSRIWPSLLSVFY